MGLLTREEEKRFLREREILAAESSEGTEDEDNSQPQIPPQTTARGLVQIVAPIIDTPEVATDESTQHVETKGPSAILVKAVADVTVEPTKERTEIVSPNSLSSEWMRSVGSEGVPQPKIGSSDGGYVEQNNLGTDCGRGWWDYGELGRRIRAATTRGGSEDEDFGRRGEDIGDYLPRLLA
ncbi:hypothetical protein AXG93_3548s1020 [Marchantia polymorpha subsp. ruderalis]|uniref:Uncharacterized protein n=1 Tax=Marchantia polymorpha subsp. ruderalis TaxID=1480154 RepID=A0A176VEM8_MARPO|nr:hypothetical protein AXG93_3548s1020 [Marchantia polymorpha subsp. ruderalis]